MFWLDAHPDFDFSRLSSRRVVANPRRRRRTATRVRRQLGAATRDNERTDIIVCRCQGCAHAGVIVVRYYYLNMNSAP